MNDLVFVRKCNKEEMPFTNSLNISKGSGVSHDKPKKTIRKYEEKLKKYGKLSISYGRESTGGRRNELYSLNEQQASFLITLLKNTDAVVDFKFNLVAEFDRMKKFIQHKQTQEYIETRQESKLLQKNTMDAVKVFVEYAKANGSKNADRYYIIYNKLINNILGIDNNSLETLESKQLLMRIKILDYIAKKLNNDIQNEIYYKDIYKSCRYKLESMIDFIRI